MNLFNKLIIYLYFSRKKVVCLERKFKCKPVHSCKFHDVHYLLIPCIQVAFIQIKEYVLFKKIMAVTMAAGCVNCLQFKALSM